MMNHLLLWASARSEGAMGALRAEIARCQISHWAGRDLLKLAHLEIIEGGPRRWRVAPPVLAARPVADGVSAVACGARTPALVEKLSRSVARLGGQVDVMAQDGAPDLIEVSAPAFSELATIAASAGFYLQPRATWALIAAAGPITAAPLEPEEMPVGQGWEVNRFSRSRLRWTEASTADAHISAGGLFRFRSSYGMKVLLCAHGRANRVAPSLGKYLVLQPRHRALLYSARSKVLRLPLDAPPPPLLERALVVASGQLPTIADRRLCYPKVQLPDAQAFAAQLGQKLF